MSDQGQPVRHPDERVAQALEAWGYDDYDLHPYHVARRLFPDFDSLRTAYTRILPESLHGIFQSVTRERVPDGGSVNIASVMNFIAKLDTMPETLPHAIAYLRCFGTEWPDSWRRTYEEFAAVCAGDPEYLMATGVDQTHQSVAVIRTLNEIGRRGVPAEYVAPLIQRPQRHLYSDSPEPMVRLYRSGVPAKAVLDYEGWDAENTIRLYEAGCPPFYAAASCGSWGSDAPNTDAGVAIYLFQAGVPAEYAQLGTDLRLLHTTIAEAYRNGVPAEYLSAL